MHKSPTLNYQTVIWNSIKSSYIALAITLLVVVPVGVFLAMVFFESEIAGILARLFPPSPRQGYEFYRDLVHLARTEVLWLGFFFLLTFMLGVYAPDRALGNFFTISVRNKAVFFMMLIASGFFLITVTVGTLALEGFPNSSDEYAYLLQAEMFSRGKLWERAHDLPDFFHNNNIAQVEGILVSRFPPGWPLLLSQAFEIGLQPSLVNPLLGVLTLVVFYFFAKRYYGELVAVWGVMFVALSGFYIFNSASYFSHTSCLLFTLLFVYCVHRYGDTERLLYGLLAGFFLGFVIIIRYYTAVLIVLPFLLFFLIRHRWKAIKLFFLIGVGSLPCLGYLLWYNYSITGNPLLPVTVWAYPGEQLGFVRGHSFLKGVEHLIRRLLMFIYWSAPGLLILYAVFLFRKIKSPVERSLRPEDYTFITLAIGYFFYYQIGGNQYGPRFLFEALPFLILLVLSKVLQSREKWATALLVASLLYAIVKLPFIIYREERIVDERQDLYDLVARQKIRNAVILVASPTCPARPMPADDLTRNDPQFSNDVIYALEIPKINDQLMDYYADRSFYRYVRDIDRPRGELIRLR